MEMAVVAIAFLSGLACGAGLIETSGKKADSSMGVELRRPEANAGMSTPRNSERDESDRREQPACEGAREAEMRKKAFKIDLWR